MGILLFVAIVLFFVIYFVQKKEKSTNKINFTSKNLNADASTYPSIHTKTVHAPIYSKQEAKIIATQRLKQIRESVKIVNTTKTPATYFGRYDFILECLTDLVRCEKAVRFSGEKPSVSLNRFRSEQQRTQSINDFLDRYAQRTKNKIQSLKTDAAKRKAVTSYESEMGKHLQLLFPQNRTLYEKKLSEFQKSVFTTTEQSLKSEQPAAIGVLQKSAKIDLQKASISQEANENRQDSAELAVRTDQVAVREESKAWEISVSFGDTTSKSLDSAVFLAKRAPRFVQTEYKGKQIYQAFYGSAPQEYLAFVQLYEMVSKWKTSVAMINGNIVDRKIIGGLNYCYGDFCRNGRSRFCYGASQFTENPFGCHRLQISASNNPWYTFSQKSGKMYYVNKNALRARIDEYATSYRVCPKFDYENIMKLLHKLPDTLTEQQMQVLNPYGAHALQQNSEYQVSGTSIS